MFKGIVNVLHAGARTVYRPRCVCQPTATSPLMIDATTHFPLPPLLRWAGSKRQHLSVLEKMAPAFTGRYIEPFAGSACLFWHLSPSRARIGDMNRELIDCYEAIREDPEKVFNIYANWENTSNEYYRIRDQFNAEVDATTRAACFMYLNRYCFNGLYRTARDGKFNVPYGGLRTGLLPNFRQLELYSKRLKDVELFCGDFEEAVNDVTAGDFVYLDPPFYTTSVRVFNSYTVAPFSSLDLDRFSRTLEAIDNRGALFVASYLDTPEIEKIAGNWYEESISVLRRMSGFQAGRKRANELVFSNFVPQDHSCH